MEGIQHDFNLRADVLEGDHPLLIGCPTLMAMKASLDFCELKLGALINESRCTLPLHRNGNHLFLDHAPRAVSEIDNHNMTQNASSLGHYKLPCAETIQYFRRPGHC
jgi:hypothetical protein